MGAVATRLDRIRTRGGLRDREVAEMLGTTAQTVSRWNQEKAEPQPESLDRLLQIEWLIDRLAELYKPDEARIWLRSPNRLLGGERPVDLIRRSKIEDVLAVIAQLHDGAYV